MPRKKRIVIDAQTGEIETPDETDSSSNAAPDGRYRTLKNGAIYDNQEKRIAKDQPGKPSTAIQNQSQAVALANLRWAKARKAATRGLARLSTDNSSLNAWSDIVESQAKLALDRAAGRASTEAARFVGQATEYTRPPNQSQAQETPGIQLNLTGEALRQILDAISNAKTQVP